MLYLTKKSKTGVFFKGLFLLIFSAFLTFGSVVLTSKYEFSSAIAAKGGGEKGGGEKGGGGKAAAKKAAVKNAAAEKGGEISGGDNAGKGNNNAVNKAREQKKLRAEIAQ